MYKPLFALIYFNSVQASFCFNVFQFFAIILSVLLTVSGVCAGIPQLSNSLSGSRLSHAGRMLDRINELIDRLDDPNVPPLHPTPSELSDYQQPPVQQHQQLITQEMDAEQDE